MEEIEVQQRYKFDISQELVLPEFYNKHKNNLPMLIVVSGGYYGQTKYDDMSTDQVCKGKTLRKYLNSEYTMLHTVAWVCEQAFVWAWVCEQAIEWEVCVREKSDFMLSGHVGQAWSLWYCFHS